MSGAEMAAVYAGLALAFAGAFTLGHALGARGNSPRERAGQDQAGAGVAVKLAAYVLALGLVFVSAFTLGHVVGPVAADPSHEGHRVSAQQAPGGARPG